MKFRQYVGEKKAKEIEKEIKKKRKKIIETNIGSTEADFLKIVARENPDGTKIKKNYNKTYLGFGINKRNIKRTFDYIRSWFFRYNIPFSAPNPYLTLYILDNLPKSSILIKKIKKEKKEKIYKPLGTLTVVSNDHKKFPKTININPDEGKDYIVLDYIPNMEYMRFIESVFDELNIDMILRLCYVKLFEIESNIVDGGFFEDMMYSCPSFPNLRLGNIGLIRG